LASSDGTESPEHVLSTHGYAERELFANFIGKIPVVHTGPVTFREPTPGKARYRCRYVTGRFPGPLLPVTVTGRLRYRPGNGPVTYKVTCYRTPPRPPLPAPVHYRDVFGPPITGVFSPFPLPWIMQSVGSSLLDSVDLMRCCSGEISLAWSTGHRVTCPGAVVGVAVPLAARSRSTGLCLARLVARRLDLCVWCHAYCLELGAL